MQTGAERARQNGAPLSYIDGLRGGFNKLMEGLMGRGREGQSTAPSQPSALVRLEPLEDYPGVITFPFNGDVLVAFSGQAYLEKLAYLKDAAVLLLQRNTLWSLDFCRQLMDKGMGVDELTWGRELNEETIAEVMKKKEREVPSVLLFREEAAPPGYYLGISVQKKLFIDAKEFGEVPVMEHILRAFEPGFRGRQRGRSAAALALLIHKGAKFYIHKTGNPIAAYTNQRADFLEQADAHPWGEVAISDPLMQEIRERTKRYVLLPGRRMLPNGVVKGDYPQRSRSFDVKELRGGALGTYKKMTDPEQLDMRIDGEDSDGKGYDSIVPLYRVK